MRDYRDAKAMAQTLRQALKERSVSLTHSESLELIAKVLGAADWNVLSAAIQASANPAEAGATFSLPVMPLRDIVLFPQMTTPIYAMRLKSLAAVERAMAGDKRIFFVTQHRAVDDTPGPSDLYDVGVVGSVADVFKLPDGGRKMTARGLQRARIVGFEAGGDCLVAKVSPIQEEAMVAEEAAALSSEVLRRFEVHANISLASPPQALIYLSHLREPGPIADTLAQYLSATIEQRQEILQTANVIRRLGIVRDLMGAERPAAA
jgi:ATP-dependent Lon protease